ncbi:MAG: HypC/HybG/HupF family hydrogenase formation chaperone [Endomicrobia bacterium]|nr:HypC/HybG/HupF family hydrogenase formation chaperone [Endomicrobiia bacterium]
MCIAIPMRVKKIEGNCAICEYEGIEREVRIDMVKDLSVGDYVLIHVGFVIQKIDLEEAKNILEIYKQIQQI